MIPLSFVLAGAVAVGVGTLMAATYRRHRVHVTCPADQTLREIVATGTILAPDAGEDVVQCGKIGETPMVGKALKCNKACLQAWWLPPVK